MRGAPDQAGPTTTSATGGEAATTDGLADQPRLEPFGPSTPSRRRAGALVVMAGAIPVALVADAGPGRLYRVLLAVGTVGLVGWLVDGRRYLGAASAALAVGLAFVVIRETTVDEYAIVFSFLGSALLFVTRVNPRAAGGSAGLLLYAAASSLSLHDPDWTLLPRPVTFALIMLAWGASGLRPPRSEVGGGRAVPSGWR